MQWEKKNALTFVFFRPACQTNVLPKRNDARCATKLCCALRSVPCLSFEKVAESSLLQLHVLPHLSRPGCWILLNNLMQIEDKSMFHFWMGSPYTRCREQQHVNLITAGIHESKADSGSLHISPTIFNTNSFSRMRIAADVSTCKILFHQQTKTNKTEAE